MGAGGAAVGTSRSLNLGLVSESSGSGHSLDRIRYHHCYSAGVLRGFLVAALLLARTAAADTLIPLRKGREIVADMSGAVGYLLSFVPRAEEPRRSLETLLQVAPGGALVAVFKPYTRELVVMDGAGAVVRRVPRCSGAFRVSPEGTRLAVVTRPVSTGVP